MVTVWHFCGCVVDFSNHCSVKLIHVSHLKCSNWRKLEIGYYICANRILDQGHQPQPLLQIRHQCGMSPLGWLPPFQQWFCCSFHWAIQLLTASVSLQASPYISVPTLGVLWPPTCTCTCFPDIFPFHVTDEIIQFPAHTLQSFQTAVCSRLRVSSLMLSTLFSLAKDEIVCLGTLKLQCRLGL